jgi:hypothetical protein
MNSQRPPVPTARDDQIWYRQPVLLLALGLLAAVIVASLATLAIALSRPDRSVLSEEEFNRVKLEMRAQSGTDADGKAGEAEAAEDRDRL